MTARVMVIEDDEALSALLEYNLVKEGHKVSLVSDGEEALIAIEEERPDLIVLDWMLPHVSGIEICRQIRARAEIKDTPVIMLTARGEEEDRIRGLETGAIDVMDLLELLGAHRHARRSLSRLRRGQLTRFAPSSSTSLPGLL